MNELKFGHRVIAWNEDKSKSFKGRFVFVESDKGFYEKPYIVLVGEDGLESFKNCELDPEADEFLIGDEVEFSHYGNAWERGIYVAKSPTDRTCEHIVIPTDERANPQDVTECRYPQEKDELDIDKVVDWLHKNGYAGKITKEEMLFVFGSRIKS